MGFKGSQKLDENGKMLLEWLIQFNLIMFNDDPNCEGEITWQKGEQKSTIDFVLASRRVYQYFQDMSIDKEKLKYDLSDHNLREITKTKR